jgi:hypothetical protein
MNLNEFFVYYEYKGFIKEILELDLVPSGGNQFL